jgi:Cu2+-exporting ATPase
VITGIHCAHCGLPVPARLVQPGDRPSFCCHGCEQVHALLHEQGLQGFYEVRAMERASSPPATVLGRDFTDYDDPSFAQRHVRATGRGTCEIELYLEGVHCAACAWLLERLPRTLPGLVSVRLDLARARGHVEWEPHRVALSAIARAFDAIGYTPHPWRKDELAELRKAEDRRFLQRVGVAAAAALNIMMLHVALYAGEATGMERELEQLLRWASLLVAIPVVTFSAWPFLRTALEGLRQRIPHIDLPIALAIEAAFLASAWNTLRGAGPVWFDSIATLTALLLAGRWLQGWAQRRALQTAERLQGAGVVDFARRRDPSGALVEVPAEALMPGEVVQVRSGETLPVDGVVLEGSSRLEQAALTGEARARAVEPGDRVWAHTTNVGDALLVRAEQVGEGTRMGALLALLDEARRRQAPIVSLTDRVSRVFVTAILSAAALSALWWALAAPDQLMERVIALLVVACPCALGLATPIAMTAALTRAADLGVYIKGADVVQTLTQVREVVFDKTGTLTQGAVALARWVGDETIRPAAAAVAARSAHPVSRALAEVTPEASGVVEGMRELPGHGVAAEVDGILVALCNRAWMQSLALPIPPSLEADASALASEGLSPVFVASGAEVRAVAGFGDALRPEAAEVIAQLRAAGWGIRILSGDHHEAVLAVARRLGLPEQAALGGRTPEEKLAWVQQATEAARARGEALMMVGDGLNDAAALAAADVGVCVAGGSGPSVQAAHVVLARPGLDALSVLAQGAPRVLGIIQRNLVFSLAYNLVGVGLALAGVVGPLLAAVLMPASSLTVISASVLSRSFVRAHGAAPYQGTRSLLGRLVEGGARWS